MGDFFTGGIFGRDPYEFFKARDTSALEANEAPAPTDYETDHHNGAAWFKAAP